MKVIDFTFSIRLRHYRMIRRMNNIFGELVELQNCVYNGRSLTDEQIKKCANL